ncbi:hypothetical protein CDG76_17670 [Nostoc sp. 'Peltigera membranacea cyanobiont' 210A]|uniref:hypothetical protein n=1 Tax=Nostoc sp. 'Peltigera membranacea cyanobiont' 210A TaxID=2014529 RepID=UPI000B9553CE|nr:hypothetical protein [Nostoc sp. 'Peltigera membranacea cyanobiont' 210A]OYD93802.1 hypothetical protein CDG76_17670 [Nostoc sp. 'Peltigera membranacea cyanobiont' 210A]
MQNMLKRAFLPGLMAATLAGTGLIPVQPASADDRVINNAAIGAGAGVLSGVVTNCGSVLDNAFKGAAAGAAVNAANGARRTRARRRNGRLPVQDIGVGAGAGVLAGAISGGCGTTWKNGVNGAAAGAAVHLLDKRPRRR